MTAADTPTVTAEQIDGLREAAEKWRRNSGFSLAVPPEAEAFADYLEAARPATIIALLEFLDATRRDYEARIAELEAERERMRVALTPSAETKAAYIGEFAFSKHYVDDDGNDVTEVHDVPWTTIKEIMAFILARATLTKEPENAGR